jgi:hypothetical protein
MKFLSGITWNFPTVFGHNLKFSQSTPYFKVFDWNSVQIWFKVCHRTYRPESRIVLCSQSCRHDDEARWPLHSQLFCVSPSRVAALRMLPPVPHEPPQCCNVWPERCILEVSSRRRIQSSSGRMTSPSLAMHFRNESSLTGWTILTHRRFRFSDAIEHLQHIGNQSKPSVSRSKPATIDCCNSTEIQSRSSTWACKLKNQIPKWRISLDNQIIKDGRHRTHKTVRTDCEVFAQRKRTDSDTCKNY